MDKQAERGKWPFSSRHLCAAMFMCDEAALLCILREAVHDRGEL
jgi:hypothetical protein